MSAELCLCDVCGEAFCLECEPTALQECAAGKRLECEACQAVCVDCQTVGEQLSASACWRCEGVLEDDAGVYCRACMEEVSR